MSRGTRQTYARGLDHGTGLNVRTKIMAEFDEIPEFLGITQALMTQGDSKYEFMDAADDNVMLFFANYKDNSKVTIIFDPD